MEEKQDLSSMSKQCSEDARDDHKLVCSESANSYTNDEDIDVIPRIGEEYQAQIPSLVAKNSVGFSGDFIIGLPISVMWIKHEVADPVVKPRGSKKIKTCHPQKSGAVSEVKIEPEDIALCNKIKTERKEVYFPVPDIPGEAWSETEEASFLLGLYLFGKNFVLLKKFVESKKMGDILLYYYGVFYHTEKYRRWLPRRRVKSRRCIIGERFFTTSRQQEFLSRLLRNLPEEYHTTLQQVSKTFSEGKMQVEEYIFTLKAAVGLAPLIDAVGIGKGKKDLTRSFSDPAKPPVAVRHEMPLGKACSNLTTEEIVQFLRGDYRLSKARSNELFWEAVWPKLLAQGWNSEEPAYRKSLVFLIPGIKKFSTRKLVKGNHYFDSVTDVLKKVASDPKLLELPDTQQEHCYIKPETGNHDVAQFTIMDTSLDSEGNSRVRDIKTLPIYQKTIQDTESEETLDESDSGTTTRTLTLVEINSAKGVASAVSSTESSYKKSNNGSHVNRNLKTPRKRKTKREDTKHLACATKRQRLIACNNTELVQTTTAPDVNVKEEKILDNPVSINENEGKYVMAAYSGTSIDLNLPVTENSETNHETRTEPEKNLPTESDGLQPEANARRQSTRNRPLTVKALEALACGYLTVKPKRKSVNDDSLARNSRRVKAKTEKPDEVIATDTKVDADTLSTFPF